LESRKILHHNSVQIRENRGYAASPENKEGRGMDLLPLLFHYVLLKFLFPCIRMATSAA
jgi:hypothetical protein